MILAEAAGSLLSPGLPRQTCGNQRTLGGVGLVIHHMVHGLRQVPIFLHEGKATDPSPPKGLFFLRQKMVMFTRLLSNPWTQCSFCLSSEYCDVTASGIHACVSMCVYVCVCLFYVCIYVYVCVLHLYLHILHSVTTHLWSVDY